MIDAGPRGRGRRRALIGGAIALPLGAGLGLGLALGDYSAGSDHVDPAAPEATALTGLPPRALAWVFSSGGPRAFVHVGVVKALHELGLKPDFVVGASAGALIATLVAAGLSGPDIETIALELQPAALLRWNASFEPGLPRGSGRAIGRWIEGLLGQRGLHELALPVAVVARRLPANDGPAVLAFTRGPVGPAVQASTAVEGQLVPVRIRGQWHADPDAVMPLPSRLARQLGAARVLAVDASAHEDRAPPGAERWHEHDRQKRAITLPDARDADLLLHPDSGYWSGLSRSYRAHCIAVGHATAMASATALRRLHGPAP